MPDILCARCGLPAVGYATIGQERYCHSDERSCYTKTLHERGTVAALAGLDRLGRSIDAAHLERQRTFSEATFGPGPRTKGVIDHIRKELAEIEADPLDLREWVDVIILAFDGAWRAGHEPQAIIDAVREKQGRNEARQWPDWRTADTDKAIEHVRTCGFNVGYGHCGLDSGHDAELHDVPVGDDVWFAFTEDGHGLGYHSVGEDPDPSGAHASDSCTCPHVGRGSVL